LPNHPSRAPFARNWQGKSRPLSFNETGPDAGKMHLPRLRFVASCRGYPPMIRYLLALAVLCFGFIGTASAQVPDTVFLERLTWDEVRDLMAAGKTTIIIPTGGTEQNGPHMAIGKHNVRVSANAEGIARRLGNALVAPVIAYVPEGGIDPPTGHMRFPGTISIPDPIFRGVLEYAARSLKQHGFRDIVFIGDNGPN